MVVVIVGLRTAGQTLNTLTLSLERLCAKEERTWKERIFNHMRLVSLLFHQQKNKHLIDKNNKNIFLFFFSHRRLSYICSITVDIMMTEKKERQHNSFLRRNEKIRIVKTFFYIWLRKENVIS
jgi:hypothetical protein